MDYSPFPYFDFQDPKPKDGTLFSLPTFCKKKFGNKCLDFYRSINVPGDFLCPFGFSVRKLDLPRPVFLSGLVVKGVSNQPKLRAGERFPELEPLEKKTLDSYEVLLKKVEILISSVEPFKAAIHDVRNINNQIKSQIEATGVQESGDANSLETSALLMAYGSAQLASASLNFLDYKLNPTRAFKKEYGLHGKFSKAAKVIRPMAWQRKVGVRLHGEMNRKIKTYDFFECVPMILIQNAVKYSPDFGDVDITFKEMGNTSLVEVINSGPEIRRDEFEKIFSREYRSDAAKKTGISGTGMGLFTLKEVCNIHDIDINVEFEKRKLINNILFGLVKFTLVITHPE